MLKTTLHCTLALIALASLALANPFSLDGPRLPAEHGYEWQADRLGLVPDGSFEAGCGVQWTCAFDQACDHAAIADLVPLGLWNYDGSYVAWLGGFCYGQAVCWTTVCQEIVVDGEYIGWYWMAYVNNSVGEVQLTVDGDIVYAYTLQPADQLLGYQQQLVSVEDYNDAGLHTVCFEYRNEDDCTTGAVDNYFVDYVEVLAPTATEQSSFSATKSLY